jgi:glycosyl transferase family 87
MKTLLKLPLSKRWNIVLLIVALLIILDAARTNVFSTDDDFVHAYNAARALLTGADLYFADSRVYIYPPFYAFFLTPLAHLSENTAHIIWILVNILLTASILWLGLRVLATAFKLNLTGWQTAGASSLAVLLTQDNIFQEFFFCQNDLLILFGFTLALYWLQRYPKIAGIVLGLMANIKYQTLVLLPLLILRARWRVIIGLAIGLAAAALLPALMVGWSQNLGYLKFALHGLINMVGATPVSRTDMAKVPSLLWIANVSITSGLGRIFNSYGLTINDALLVVGILMGLLLVLLWKIFYQHNIPFFWRTPYRLGHSNQETAIINLEWWISVVVMLIFSPECTRRHLVLVLCFNLLPVVMLLFPQPGVKRWPIITAIILAQVGQLRFGFGFPFGDFVGLPGWGYLLSLLLITYSAISYYRVVYGYPQSLIKKFPYRSAPTITDGTVD